MKIVIAGAGSIGRYLVERLNAEEHSLVVIDMNEEILEQLQSQFDIQTIKGSAVSIENLKAAGVEKADIIVAATNSDEANLVAGLLARSMNPDIKNVARIRGLVTDETGLSSSITGAFDHFINPDIEAASFLFNLFQVHGASDVIEVADGRVRLVGVSLQKDSPVVGKKLRELAGIEGSEGMLVVAIIRDGELIIPRGEHRIQAGDNVYIAAESHHTEQIFNIVGKRRRPLKNVMIWGGTNTGKKLAEELSSIEVKVKLIESDLDLCHTLADELNDVLVLHGDGTDQELLIEEGVEDLDMFVAATEDDEVNILSVILAKRLGANAGALIISKLEYLHILPSLGIDLVVNPRIAGASSILKFVRKGIISSAFSIRDDSAEIIEMVADSHSKLVGQSLQNLELPPGVIITAVINEAEVTIARGDTVINEGDHLVVFANRKGMPRLDKFLDI